VLLLDDPGAAAPGTLAGGADRDGCVMTGILGQALAYAAAGWPVFPCKPGLKAPNTEHGFLDATTDPEAIRAWWTAHPRDNVAIRTGAPAIDVLDVDVKPDGNGFAAFNRLKRAGLLTGASTIIRTRSGGLHLYYTGTAQRSTGLAEHFLDFKAAGGYVIAPPSFVEADDKGPAGFYEVLERRDADGILNWQAVRQLLTPAPAFTRPPRRAASSGRRDRPGDDYNARAEWDEILTPHGWRQIRGEASGTRYWCRPGKAFGVSATTREDGGLYVFSTSTPFQTGEPYSKFAAYAILNHGGDYRAASQALAAAGYGTARKAGAR
jgi:hypothetical protein